MGGRERRETRYCDSFKTGAKLEFHAEWSGWTRPPTMGGGGGSHRANRSAKVDSLGEYHSKRKYLINYWVLGPSGYVMNTTPLQL